VIFVVVDPFRSLLDAFKDELRIFNRHAIAHNGKKRIIFPLWSAHASPPFTLARAFLAISRQTWQSSGSHSRCTSTLAGDRPTRIFSKAASKSGAAAIKRAFASASA
jgi:hypothetical protein